jgi:hypothetical protein
MGCSKPFALATWFDEDREMLFRMVYKRFDTHEVVVERQVKDAMLGDSWVPDSLSLGDVLLSMAKAFSKADFSFPGGSKK